MGKLVLRVGAHSAQGLRPNNQDRFLADPAQDLFLVADGMGGQDSGEKASGLAVDIIPQAFAKFLAAHGDATYALVEALEETNRAIVDASRHQMAGRRMGTTAVLAVRRADRVYVTGLGDSRAYLIRAGNVEQLTVDHTVAEALMQGGTLTPEQARQSPTRHVLYKFLGCAEMNGAAQVRPFTPQAGDRLVLASDGLTNFVTEEDLASGPDAYPDPQEWADHLVLMALERGSNDNVTCVVVAFEPE
jgi:protein phosphatase